MATKHSPEAIGRLTAAVAALAAHTAGRARTEVTHEAADEVVGSAASDDAIGFDPFVPLRALHDEAVPAVVMGQVAGILHGSLELTGDLDLLWDGDASHAPGLVRAFVRVGATLTDGDHQPRPLDPSSFALPKVLFRAPSASGDCCTPDLPWGQLDIAGILERAAVARTGDGLVIRYVGRDDLIAMRRAAGRPKDLRRADELARRPG